MVADLKDCDATLKAKISSDNGFCGLLVDASDMANPFRTCLANSQINAAAFTDNCIFDICALQDDDSAKNEAACGTLAALAMQCKNLGILVDWREASECRESFY